MEHGYLRQLKHLMAINSHTGNKFGVDQVSQQYGQWLGELGYQQQVYERADIGDHRWFQSPHLAGHPRVLLLGHCDTVFPPGSFEQVSEDERWLYGPGACDMKGGNMVALQALRNSAAEQGGIANIDVLMVSDEETGSEDSSALTYSLAKLYDYCLVFEAAGAEHQVVTARKGVATWQLSFTGKAAHAGNHFEEGFDANLAAAKATLALAELTEFSVDTTVNVGLIKGGRSANTISPEARLVVEARFTLPDERDRLLQQVEIISAEAWQAGVTCSLSGGLQRDVMSATLAQAKLLAEIESVLGYALSTEARGGVSDANVVASSGVPVLDGFGPYGDGDHTLNERACKGSLARRIDEVSQILNHFNCYQRSTQT